MTNKLLVNDKVNGYRGLCLLGMKNFIVEKKILESN